MLGYVINRSNTDDNDDDYGDDKEKEGVECSYTYRVYYVGVKRKFTVLEFHGHKKIRRQNAYISFVRVGHIYI